MINIKGRNSLVEQLLVNDLKNRKDIDVEFVSEAYASGLKNNKPDSDEIVAGPQQIDYKNGFVRKYKFKEFYFDDADLVDAKTSKTIPGVKLNKSTAKEITTALIKHFKLQE